MTAEEQVKKGAGKSNLRVCPHLFSGWKFMNVQRLKDISLFQKKSSGYRRIFSEIECKTIKLWM